MATSDYEAGEVAEEVYDDLDYAPGSGKRAPSDGYQLTNVLKLPRATTYSTQALYDQVHAGDIDLEPEYQRDVVWPESKQVGLIDSILRNFYVPPIIFVAHQYEDGSETKTCIDGKQRLTSIHRFMDGLIPHRDPNTGTKYWYRTSPTSQSGRGQLLPDRYRRLFANKQIVCVEYQDLPDSEEREIFQRVQLGMALTPAEKLQVINSPMSTFVRKLQAEYFNTGSPLDGEVFDWDRSRGGDFRCIAQALYVISKHPLNLTLGAISQLERWLHDPVAPSGKGRKKKKKTDADAEAEREGDLSQDPAFLERIHATFRMFSKLVGDTSLHAQFLRPEWRVSPVEFITMCLLISVDKDDLTLEQVAVRLGEMRRRVRHEHVDIRMNARVAKTMFDFIQERQPVLSSMPAPTMPELGQEGGLKRKREEEDDDMAILATTNRNKDNGAGSTPAQTQAPSSAVTVFPPPPRPDRLWAVREAKMVIAPPRVTPPRFPNTPSALR